MVKLNPNSEMATYSQRNKWKLCFWFGKPERKTTWGTLV